MQCSTAYIEKLRRRCDDLEKLIVETECQQAEIERLRKGIGECIADLYAGSHIKALLKLEKLQEGNGGDDDDV